MARSSNLASMSVEALIKMRDDIGKILSNKVGQLQSQLAALGHDGWMGNGKKKAVGRPKGSALKGTKVAPKYRNPKNRSETWAGRGAMPRWMAAAVKAGKKKESFLIDKSAAKTAANTMRAPAGKGKRGRPVKKRQKAAAPRAGNGAAAAAGENT
jgi:DNA-binding protein H-NS